MAEAVTPAAAHPLSALALGFARAGGQVPRALSVADEGSLSSMLGSCLRLRQGPRHKQQRRAKGCPSSKRCKLHCYAQTPRQDTALGHDAVAFIFCPQGQSSQTTLKLRERECENDDRLKEERASFALLLGEVLPPQISIGQYAAMVLPGLVASHYGLIAGPATGLAPACMPLPVLFSVPYVSQDSWLANKRARAFHRCCIITVYLQGGFALFKFARGDLIGGVYDAVQCAIGAYAIEPEGLRLMPSYIMVSGFNGLLGLIQVFQAFHGVPIASLPLLAIAPPVISLSAAYFGYQFCKEINAIGSGMPSDGAQDSCFVRAMSGDWWPSSMGPSTSFGGATDPASQGGPTDSGPRSRFNPFAGDGHRLGGE